MSVGIPTVDITEDDLSSFDSTVTSDISFDESITNLSSEGNLSNFSLKDIKDDYIYDDNGDNDSKVSDLCEKEIDGESTLPYTHTSGIRQKENREHSPFKEAIRGFVLSKLAKKSENMAPLENDKRTLFSGIKEKIVKKLEDSSVKDSNCREAIVISPEINEFTEVLVKTVGKDECELKSVVANDRLDSSATVEEAEECFEEIHVPTSLKNGIYGVTNDYGDQHLPVSAAPRSKTMSNIAATAQHLLRPKANVDRNLSVSFSDLQKADVEGKILKVDSSPPRSSDNLGEISNSSSINPPAETEHTSPSTATENNSTRTVSSHSEGFPKRIYNCFNDFLTKSFRLDIIILMLAVLAYYCLYNHQFLCGLFSGILLAVFFSLMFTNFTTSLNDYNSQFPSYKDLPPLNAPFVSDKRTFTHEGWMNQLNHDYDPNNYKLTDTVSVLVRIDNETLHLSYPRKNVPRRAMWNEKRILTNPMTLELQYNLLEAKILLLPEGISNNRLWNKRYPLCIVLCNEEDEPNKLELSVMDDKEPDSSTKSSSRNNSQPSSTSSTPAHVPRSHNKFFLFARTDREKEEWYWKLMYASRGEFEVSVDSSETEVVPVITKSSSSGEIIAPSVSHRASKSSLSSKEEDSKSLQYSLKPTYDFHHYMDLLIREEPSNQENPHAKWLNVMLGRLFFDFFVQKQWADKVMHRIQNKFDRIRMPQYMQRLVVTDVHLGTSLPQIKNISDATVDERGLWLDVDIDYQGFFQMTVETKLKSLRRSFDKLQSDESGAEIGTDAHEDLCEYWDEDDDFPDSETSKEDSPLHQAAVMSTGTKLLHSVEKWVNASNLSENNFVKRYVGQLIQTKLLITVEINNLKGQLAINIPPVPTDRLWYGFRKNPELSLNVYPKVGERHINLLPVIQIIKRKLVQEFQKALVMPNMDDLVVPIMVSTVHNQI